jgi:hypothetical protein
MLCVLRSTDINFTNIWNNEELPPQWKESILYLFIKKGDKTNSIHYRGMTLLKTANKIISNILFSKSTPDLDEIMWIISLDFGVIDRLLIRYSLFVRYWRKMGV